MTFILTFLQKSQNASLIISRQETIQSQCAKYRRPIRAASHAFSHWRCINGRAECIAMHSRIIQEDIADSTRGRELVETKV